MIWHVIKKDFKSLWWLGPVFLGAAVAYAYSRYYLTLPIMGSPKALLIVGGPYLAVILALARAVQVDAPASKLGDWHTRPISRWTLLSAKALVALVGWVLLWGAADFGFGLWWGLSPLDSFSGAAIHMATLSAMAVAVIALAACFRSLILFLVSLAALFAAALTVGMNMEKFLRWASPGWSGDVAGFQDTGIWIIFLVILAGLLLAIYLLYNRRRVGKARTVILAATLGVEIVAMVLAQANGMVWRPYHGAEPTEAQGMTIAADGNPILHQYGKTETPAMLSLPLQITNPSGADFLIERSLATQTWRDGRSVHYAPNGGLLPARQTLDYFSRGERIDLNPSRLEMKYYLRLYKPAGETVTVGRNPIDNLPAAAGVCRETRIAAPYGNDRTRVLCISAKPVCLKMTTESRGRTNSALYGCRSVIYRALTGFYERNWPEYLSNPRVTPMTKGGQAERSFSLDWFTPTKLVGEEGVDPSPQPSPAVNAE